MKVMMFLAVFVQISICADLTTLLTTRVYNDGVVVSFKLLENVFGGEMPSFVKFRSIVDTGDLLPLTSQVLFE